MVLCDEPSLTVSLTDTGYHLIMTIMVVIIVKIFVNTFFKLNLKDILTGQDLVHYRKLPRHFIFTNFAQSRN